MSQTAISAAIGIGSVILSGFVSAFIAGARWGSVSRQVADVASQQGNAATQTDIQGLKERLARIEGMFELKLRDGAA